MALHSNRPSVVSPTLPDDGRLRNAALNDLNRDCYTTGLGRFTVSIAFVAATMSLEPKTKYLRHRNKQDIIQT